MNDFDLNSRLKSVPVPDRPEDYWDNFPAQVRRNLRCATIQPVVENLWLPRLAWAGGLALVLVIGLGCPSFQPLQAVSLAIAKHENHFRRELAQFHTNLTVLMRDEHGLHRLIAEKE